MGKFRLKTKYLLLFIIIFVLFYSLSLSQSLFYPSDFKIIKGENKNLNISFPFSLDNRDVSIVETIFNEGKKSITLNGIDEGETNLQIKLLGLIPVKNYNVNVVNRPELVPGGNAIGVRMNTKGVLVVAVTEVINIKGNRISPARESGLKVGDSIIEINGEKISSAEQVVRILNNVKEEAVNIVVLRNKEEIKITATPIQCLQDNSYRLGIWVRDKTSGIGTMTFYDKKSNKFGALGHGISDMDTGKLLNVDNGLVMNAKISDIEQGKKGTPGEIKGVFYKTDDILGEIYDNNDYGIYGVLKDNDDIKIKNSIPIGYKEEVKPGKAYILSTLDDNIVDKYEIEILKVEPQEKPQQKSMIIKVTDERLLNKTGGIIQGMSGSPIIQDDKLIGAITHVFVNDPTKGYGIYIEWMLENIK
ncbi:SpoIVB peptidase [Paratissierella segnis]|uniref:SpoIVB peptidase n=1 Tax=Paratissierella segnis TaxID=2763679 RepID=A0A926EXQ8_9FIRM|nr:SpoIVB peptidase [Paratissierella segnis]MBC8588427.1 SpoIVB peptidase [Paratissierella segnis]